VNDRFSVILRIGKTFIVFVEEVPSDPASDDFWGASSTII